jgi:MtN3 and saliva related transmembrane protein
MISQYVGILAGVLTGVSMLPQLIKIIREKEADSVSLLMLIVLLAGLAGWVWYGILKNDYPIIITNSFSFLTNLSIIILTLIYRARN